MVRAVIWTAVSTKAQNADDRDSLPSQERDARALCEREGFEVVEVLSVPGHSRRYTDIHELARAARKKHINAFDRLLALWDDRGFDVLVCWDGNRFARTQSLFSRIVEDTIDMGARIYSLSDGWVDVNNYRMWIAMCGYKSASEVDTLNKKRNIGMKKRVERGLNSHRVPIGFMLTFKPGTPHPDKLLHDPAQRKLVDDMAELLLDGVGWMRFGDELHNRYGHINLKTGKPYTSRTFVTFFYNPFVWGHTAFNYFKNLGAYAFDESAPVPDGVTIHRNALECGALYQGELANKIKDELRRRDEVKGSASTNRSFYFTGLALCGKCGNVMTVQSKEHWYRNGEKRPSRGAYTNWYCHHYRNYRTCDNKRIIRDDTLKEYFTLLLGEIKRHGLKMLRSGQVKKPGQVDTVQRKITDLEKQIDALIINQATAPEAVKDRYTRQIEQSATRLETLRNELTDARINQSVQERQHLQDSAYFDLQAITVDEFWALPAKEVNRRLRWLLNNVRVQVTDGEITGLVELDATS